MSKIGARALLRRLGGILGIEDVKQAPSELDTTSVKVVAPIDLGWAGYTAWKRFASVIPIDGAGNGIQAWPVVGDQAQGFSLVFPDAARKRDTAGEENVVLGMSIQITYTNPGSTTDAGTEVEIFARFRPSFVDDPVSSSPCSIPAFKISQPRHRYVWSYPAWSSMQTLAIVTEADDVFGFSGISGPYLWVPAGAGLDIVIDHHDANGDDSGVVYPAGTNLEVYSWGVSCPKGFKPPGM